MCSYITDSTWLSAHEVPAPFVGNLLAGVSAGGRAGRAIDLSALEFKLLSAFIRSSGRVLTRDQLLDAAWGSGVALNDRVVDNHIVSLRRKLEPEPSRPKHFLNIRGMGYRFDA